MLKHEDKCVKLFGTLHREMTKNATAAYVPVYRQVYTIFWFTHKELLAQYSNKNLPPSWLSNN